jgi:amidase
LHLSAKKDENSNSDKDSDSTFELEEETIEGLRKKLISGEYTSSNLEIYLNVLKT